MKPNSSNYSNSAEPQISIIMTFKNSEPFLPDTINSILNQTEGRFILNAINDGSSDNGELFLKNVQDNRLNILSPGNIGLVKALNLGIQCVDTPYIAICDSDDIYVNTRFEKQLEFLNSHPNHVLVGSNIKYFGSSILERTWSISMPTENRQIIDALSRGLSAIVHSTVLFRTDAIKSIGGYKEETFPAPDYHLFFELTKYGAMANLNDNLAYVRLHKSSIMSNQLYEGLIKYEKSQLAFNKDRDFHIFNKKKSFFFNNFFLNLNHLEFRGLTLYRKGIFYYVNNNMFKGILLIFVAGVISPRRSIIFIKRIISQKLAFPKINSC